MIPISHQIGINFESKIIIVDKIDAIIFHFVFIFK